VPVIKIRVFRRILSFATANNVQIAIDDVSAEVNAFLASLPNLGDALQTQTTATVIGTNLLYAVTVTYVET